MQENVHCHISLIRSRLAIAQIRKELLNLIKLSDHSKSLTTFQINGSQGIPTFAHSLNIPIGLIVVQKSGTPGQSKLWLK